VEWQTMGHPGWWDRTLWLTGKQVPELLTQLVLGVFASYFVSGLARPKGSGRKPKAAQATQATQEKEGE